MPATEFIRAPWASPAGVSSILLEPPAAEPLTREEAKLRAGLDWADGDPRDLLMDGFVKAARQKVEADTGLALLEQTRRVYISAVSGDVLPMPAQTIPTVSITADDGSAPPEFVDGAWTFPAGYIGTLTVVSGWPDPLALAAEAPLLVHAVGLLVAHMATLGRDLASSDEAFLIPLGYEDAIQPYRLLRLP
jgi:hypothetical protein